MFRAPTVPLSPPSVAAFVFAAGALAACGFATRAAHAQDEEPARLEFERSSGGEVLPEEAAYDALHYAIALTVDPVARRIDGTVELRARLVAASPSIVLDLDPLLAVQSVALDGTTVETPRVDDRLYVPTAGLAVGAQFTVTIAYGGEPLVAANPPWSGGFTWTQTRDGSPWIATSCQGEGGDLWWPCKDHPSDEVQSLDLAIRVPNPLVVATNGRLVSVDDGGDGWSTHRWHVSTPINNYGVALAIAPYATLTTDYESVDGSTFPFTFWVLPEHAGRAKKVFAEFQRHMRVLEELCGPYPFRGDKYGVAHVPFLGMEHQSIIAYGSEFGVDPWNGLPYDALHFHELAHEWWGNLVTAADWNDFWIHEGIGTYMQPLYLERTTGADNYRAKMQFDRGSIGNKGALAPRGARNTKWMYFSGRGSDSPGGDIYYKGSWVCHSLRWLLGDEKFFVVLRRWAYPDPESEKTTDGSACRLATTDELLAIAEEHCGLELDWFFDVYVRNAPLPNLVEEVVEGELRLSWSHPTQLPFPMPVEVEVAGSRHRVAIGEDGIGRLAVGAQKFTVDPDGWLLREKPGRRAR
jgi:aminopeptidase N